MHPIVIEGINAEQEANFNMRIRPQGLLGSGFTRRARSSQPSAKWAPDSFRCVADARVVRAPLTRPFRDGGVFCGERRRLFELRQHDSSNVSPVGQSPALRRLRPPRPGSSGPAGAAAPAAPLPARRPSPAPSARRAQPAPSPPGSGTATRAAPPPVHVALHVRRRVRVVEPRRAGKAQTVYAAAVCGSSSCRAGSSA